VTHLNSGVLQIYPLHVGDSGVYRCRGSNAAGRRLGSETQVIVTPGNALPAHCCWFFWFERFDSVSKYPVVSIPQNLESKSGATPPYFEAEVSLHFWT